MTAQNPQFLLDKSFEDVGQFGQAIGWDMDFRQLESGKLNARATVVGGQNVQLIKFHLNRGFHQLGSTPGGMLTFGFLDPDICEITWCSQVLAGGSMTNFNRKDGFDCVSWAGFAGYAVIIDPLVIERLAIQMGYSGSIESLVRAKSSWSSPNTLGLSRKLADLYCKAGRLGASALNESSEFINHEIALNIVEELTCKTDTPTIAQIGNKTKILKKAIEVMNDPNEIPITVSRLCDRIGTSSSSLNRLFLAEFGISPKAYIRSRCLSAVRDALACAPPRSKVSDIANRWGFWHMGQFAADYRKLFGELPSSSLRYKT